MDYLPVVQAIYEAFGRGDVPTILKHLHPDVAWEYDSIDHGVPWLIPRRGRDEVAMFFVSLQQLDFRRFEPVSFLTGPGQVVALIRIELVVLATGKQVTDLEAHVFTFDDTGLVTRFRHIVDTHQHLQALS